MEMTWIGYALIPLGVYWVLFRPDGLLGALIFSVSFSATAVVNFPSIPFGFQAYHYLALLLIIRRGAIAFFTRGIGLSRSAKAVIGLALIFWLSAVATLVSLPAEQVTITNLAQLAHLGLGVLTMSVVAIEIRQRLSAWRTVAAYLAGAVAVSLWGFVQFALYFLGISYPDNLFNNSVGQYAGGYVSIYDEIGIPRVSSAATEPSTLATFLLSALAILLILIIEWPDTKRRTTFYLRFVIIAIALGLTTSATGYVGIAILAVYLVIRLRSRSIRIWPVFYAALFAALIGALFWPDRLSEAINVVLLDKTQTFSFLDRTESISRALEAFLVRPWLGYGLGSITSHDLVVKLLSNTGAVGALFFFAFLVALFIAARQSMIESKWLIAFSSRCEAALLLALGTAVLVEIATSLFSGFYYTYGSFWVLFGLLLGCLQIVDDAAKKRRQLMMDEL